MKKNDLLWAVDNGGERVVPKIAYQAVGATEKEFYRD